MLEDCYRTSNFMKIHMDIWWKSLEEGSVRRQTYTYTGQQNTDEKTYVSAPSGIRTLDHNVREVKYSNTP